LKLVNIGILAHVDAGKTTITEQILFLTKSARSIGSVDSGTTRSDFLEVEKKRGISVYASLLPVTYGDTTINIVDTPDLLTLFRRWSAVCLLWTRRCW